MEQNNEKLVEVTSIQNKEQGHIHGPNCQHHHHHEALRPIVREMPRIGRNDPCLCGSGKKYKKCCSH